MRTELRQKGAGLATDIKKIAAMKNVRINIPKSSWAAVLNEMFNENQTPRLLERLKKAEVINLLPILQRGAGLIISRKKPGDDRVLNVKMEKAEPRESSGARGRRAYFTSGTGPDARIEALSPKRDFLPTLDEKLGLPELQETRGPIERVHEDIDDILETDNRQKIHLEGFSSKTIPISDKIQGTDNNKGEIRPEYLSDDKPENIIDALAAIFRRAEDISSNAVMGTPARNLGYQKKIRSNVGFEPEVVEWLKTKAKPDQHFSHVNSILRAMMEAENAPPENTPEADS